MGHTDEDASADELLIRPAALRAGADGHRRTCPVHDTITGQSGLESHPTINPSPAP
jgi:hypothetical protein